MKITDLRATTVTMRLEAPLGHSNGAHYHHLTDDVIKGGKLRYVDGKIAVPKGPGLGVELDHDKLAEYAELYRELGGYAYDRDPGRPDWYTVMPERHYADPAAGSEMPRGDGPPQPQPLKAAP